MVYGIFNMKRKMYLKGYNQGIEDFKEAMLSLPMKKKEINELRKNLEVFSNLMRK